MANRNRNNNGVTRGQFLAVLAFVVLIVAAVVWLLTGILDLQGPILGVASLLLNISIVVVIAVAAYPFAKANRRSAWWIIYWIIVIIALIGAAVGGVLAII
ncbi:MAG: hypothetical protein FWE03_02545 [Firmicutes bacterium]|nr:hypothetical protein [Bacillota bacterium]